MLSIDRWWFGAGRGDGDVEDEASSSDGEEATASDAFPRPLPDPDAAPHPTASAATAGADARADGGGGGGPRGDPGALGEGSGGAGSRPALVRGYERRDAGGAPVPLEPQLVTLSLLPRSQWQSLVHLDAIKVQHPMCIFCACVEGVEA